MLAFSCYIYVLEASNPQIHSQQHEIGMAQQTFGSLIHAKFAVICQTSKTAIELILITAILPVKTNNQKYGVLLL